MLWKYITFGTWCMMKYMVGIGMGVALGIPFLDFFLISGFSGSIGITFYTIFGQKLLRWWNKGKDIEAPSGWKKKVWDKFGIIGVAILTPPLLSQVIGTSLALAFGTPKLKIIIYLSASIWLWSFIFAYFGQQIIQWFS